MSDDVTDPTNAMNVTDAASATPVTPEADRIVGTVADGIGWITINHPERRNALSLAMWRSIADVANRYGADPAVRAVVLTGAGDRSFSAGADISEFERVRADAAQKKAYAEIADAGKRALEALDKPLIAAIRGYCVGGGLALALLADLRFATPASTFAIPAARLGLGYDYDGIAALARLVGPSRAKDILFSARHLDGVEAHRIGLVDTLAEPDALDGTVRAYAARIADNAPLTMRAAKAAVRLYEAASPVDTTAVDRLVAACFDSDDYKEGRRAFLEKRKPRFGGS